MKRTQAVALMMPVDEERAPADIVQDGGANVRLQTGAVGFGPVSAGTGPVGTGFDTIFTSVFGQLPTGIYGSAFNDASGYTPLVPAPSNVTFTFTTPVTPAMPSVSPTTTINERNYALLQINDQAAPVEGLLPVYYP
jgi:hypothetical protein